MNLKHDKDDGGTFLFFCGLGVFVFCTLAGIALIIAAGGDLWQ